MGQRIVLKTLDTLLSIEHPRCRLSLAHIFGVVRDSSFGHEIDTFCKVFWLNLFMVLVLKIYFHKLRWRLVLSDGFLDPGTL